MNLVAFVKKEWPAVTAHIVGIGSAVTAFVQNKGGVKEAVMGGGGLLIVAVVAAVHKLTTGKIDVATIYQAGHDFIDQLPQLRDDLAKTVTFIEAEWPASKQLIAGASSRLSAAESNITDLAAKVTGNVGLTKADVESVLRELLGGLIPSAPVPAPVAAPEAVAAPV